MKPFLKAGAGSWWEYRYGPFPVLGFEVKLLKWGVYFDLDFLGFWVFMDFGWERNE